MGSILSHEQNGHQEEQGSSALRHSKKVMEPISLYAEIVTDKALPADIPPIKVLIHDQIVSTAADSIRDSETVVNQLSKALILDFLTSPTSPEKFGTLLRYVFGYEYLVQPSRELIYWSLRNEHTSNYISKTCKNGATQWIYSQSGPLISTNLRSWMQGNGYTNISEIVRWGLQQEDITILPFTEIVTQSLPYAKVILIAYKISPSLFC